ncbi:class I SAM-dependent methyltransferase [Alteribacillus bidgolensis]|uniref:Ubiquinone/menaquinone biosynthesis C-methylase UbiE n=1 Tax=Alteribacillus bidgolensis TaxID=930129 RepID=A0A1G8FWH9_9BACI|nr:class I SAM-dependent methyltransferase [Alteribacillus bidgolensis]SDH86502.1 Ubiquinone/menaquinone biosynthesis C-methylase UbiE [Alteribacillus bidgolensis]
MNNRWNTIIYKFWSPIYDNLFNSGKFLEARKKIFQGEKFGENQHILFVGVGTGADLELINYKDLNITAIDYSYEMLEKAKAKCQSSSIQFFKMDAQDMNFKDNQFDVVIASLVLSVVPDADKCMKEMVRILKPDGKIIIFDKFSPKGKKLSLMKKIIRPFINFLGTDIGVNFETLYESNKENLTVKQNESIMFKGMYREIVISKNSI